MSILITDTCAICRGMIRALPRIGCLDCAQLSSCTASINKEASYCGERCLNIHKTTYHHLKYASRDE